MAMTSAKCGPAEGQGSRSAPDVQQWARAVQLEGVDQDVGDLGRGANSSNAVVEGALPRYSEGSHVHSGDVAALKC